MPITFPFFLFAKPAENALRWIRIDQGQGIPGGDLADPRWAEAQRRIAERLPPHLRCDVVRDE